MVHTVALEMGDAAIVHCDRDVDDQRAARPAQGLCQVCQRSKLRFDGVDGREKRVPRALRAPGDKRKWLVQGHDGKPDRREPASESVKVCVTSAD